MTGSGRAVRHRADLTSFVGRELERAALTAALAEHRLVTVVGPGGAGKTRLATAVAGAHGRPSLVELAPVDDLQSVVTVIATALSAPASSLDELTAQIGTRAMTLVLDNCEHVVEAAAAAAAALVEGCPRVRVLATSRTPLALPGERLLRLGPLEVDDAVALFRERAALVADVDDDVPAVRRICERVDCLPLAIELTASHARTLSLVEIDQRLGDQLTFLRSATRTVEARQQTIEAAIDWGYRLLDDEQRLLLRRLTVFVESFTVDAVEAVCDGDAFAAGVYDAFIELVDASFVHRLPVEGPARYRLLEPVRQYAVARLAEAGRDACMRTAVLRRDGTSWLVGTEPPARVPHVKGLDYLARLVATAGVDVPAVELADAVVVERADIEALDEASRRQYRDRLVALDQAIEAARRRGDAAGEEAAEAERAVLVRELSRAVGLGGRARPMSSTVERARTSVTKALRSAIDRVAAVAPEVGEHLAAAVTTGNHCRYEPDPRWRWELRDGG